MLLCMFFFFFLKLHKTERDKLDIITVPRNSSANVCNFFFFQRNLTKWQKEQRKNERRIWDKDMKKRRRGKEKGWGKK